MGRGIRKRSLTADERDLVARLLRARTEARLSQWDVARRLGRSQSYVSKIERGARGLEVLELPALARIYGKPISYFFGE